MPNIDKLDDQKVLEVAQKRGYDPKKSGGLEEYRTHTLEMDLWDRSKALFFGPTWENY